MGSRKRYTVYDNDTDFPICVHETAARAAELMGLSSVNSFRCSLKRARQNNNKGKWTILTEMEGDDESEEADY